MICIISTLFVKYKNKHGYKRDPCKPFRSWQDEEVTCLKYYKVDMYITFEASRGFGQNNIEKFYYLGHPGVKLGILGVEVSKTRSHISGIE